MQSCARSYSNVPVCKLRVQVRIIAITQKFGLAYFCKLLSNKLFWAIKYTLSSGQFWL